MTPLFQRLDRVIARQADVDQLGLAVGLVAARQRVLQFILVQPVFQRIEVDPVPDHIEQLGLVGRRRIGRLHEIRQLLLHPGRMVVEQRVQFGVEILQRHQHFVGDAPEQIVPVCRGQFGIDDDLRVPIVLAALWLSLEIPQRAAALEKEQRVVRRIDTPDPVGQFHDLVAQPIVQPGMTVGHQIGQRTAGLGNRLVAQMARRFDLVPDQQPEEIKGFDHVEHLDRAEPIGRLGQVAARHFDVPDDLGKSRHGVGLCDLMPQATERVGGSIDRRDLPLVGIRQAYEDGPHRSGPIECCPENLAQLVDIDLCSAAGLQQRFGVLEQMTDRAQFVIDQRVRITVISLALPDPEQARCASIEKVELSQRFAFGKLALFGIVHSAHGIVDNPLVFGFHRLQRVYGRRLPGQRGIARCREADLLLQPRSGDLGDLFKRLLRINRLWPDLEDADHGLARSRQTGRSRSATRVAVRHRWSRRRHLPRRSRPRLPAPGLPPSPGHCAIGPVRSRNRRTRPPVRPVAARGRPSPSPCLPAELPAAPQVPHGAPDRRLRAQSG
ncbi:MAG: hypothetical protein K2Q27_12050 [Novosphingobium sp.]|nr:hypothetical protein [Novosphingobium sp.]